MHMNDVSGGREIIYNDWGWRGRKGVNEKGRGKEKGGKGKEREGKGREAKELSISLASSGMLRIGMSSCPHCPLVSYNGHTGITYTVWRR